MTIDDISTEHVSGVRVGIAQKVGKAHGRKRIAVTEGVFVKLDHSRMVAVEVVVIFAFWLVCGESKGTFGAIPKPSILSYQTEPWKNLGSCFFRAEGLSN